MICPSCGGEHADWARICPYCGSVNEQVDEEVYLAHLEEMRRKLDNVDEEAETVYETTVKSTFKKVFKWFIIVFASVAALVIVCSLLFD